MAEARTPETVEATGAADKAADAADEATMEDFISSTSSARPRTVCSRACTASRSTRAARRAARHALPRQNGQRRGGRRLPPHRPVPEHAWDNSVTDLAVDYVRTFIGHGVDAFSAAYPFESVYTSEKRLLMQEGARDEVLGHLPRGGPRQAGQLEGGRGPHRARAGVRADPCEPHVEALERGDEDEAFSLLTTQKNFLDDPSGRLGAHDDVGHEALCEKPTCTAASRTSPTAF